MTAIKVPKRTSQIFTAVFAGDDNGKKAIWEEKFVATKVIELMYRDRNADMHRLGRNFISLTSSSISEFDTARIASEDAINDRWRFRVIEVQISKTRARLLWQQMTSRNAGNSNSGNVVFTDYFRAIT